MNTLSSGGYVSEVNVLEYVLEPRGLPGLYDMAQFLKTLESKVGLFDKPEETVQVIDTSRPRE